MKNNNRLSAFATTLLLLTLPLVSKALDAGVSFAVFSTPDKPFVEVNIEIPGLTITYLPVDSTHMQASVEVLILIKRGEEVVNYAKYILNSPIVTAPRALLDVKRLPVPNGEYTLEVSFQDVKTPTNKKSFSYPLKVDVGAGLYLADLQLLRSFHADDSDNPFAKNGYFLEPLPFNYYDRSATILAFYTEVYHSNQAIAQGASYLVRYFIEEEVNATKKNLVSVGTQRKKSSAADALLVQMEIGKLETGNYILTAEIRTAGNELLATKSLRFQRSNPFLSIPDVEMTDDLMAKQFVQTMNEQELKFSLRAISVVVAGDDAETVKNVLKSNDLKQMRYVLFRHFAKKNPNSPEIAFQEYIQQANSANDKYKSGFRYGFETDRGRMFMKYGKPNDVIHVEDDPSAAPYEIWVYEFLPKTKQQNVKFLFYNPSLAGDDYILLHSNARGELNNPRWERDLYQRNAGEQYNGANYQDATQMKPNIGRNARTYFEDF